MYAVVRTGGKQYRVEAGSTLIVEKLGAEAGSQVTFDRVLLVGDGEKVTVGHPTVEGATVSGTVLGESLGEKIVVFKFKQKVKYRRRTGHRQRLTRVRIDAITAAGRTVRVEPLPSSPASRDRAPVAAAEPAAAPKRRVRRPTASAAKAPSEAPETAESADAAATTPAKATPARRSRGRAAAAPPAEPTEATPSAAEEPARPRTRRAAKPKTESAKEE